MKKKGRLDSDESMTINGSTVEGSEYYADEVEKGAFVG
jgi:hypothetical protein